MYLWSYPGLASPTSLLLAGVTDLDRGAWRGARRVPDNKPTSIGTANLLLCGFKTSRYLCWKSFTYENPSEIGDK